VEEVLVVEVGLQLRQASPSIDKERQSRIDQPIPLQHTLDCLGL
jgi:hypothetical protein